MTDAQRDWAAELKAVIAEMREVVRLRKLFGEQEASLALWADRLSALAEAAPGEAVAWLNQEKLQILRDKISAVTVWSNADPDNRIPLCLASPPLAPERAEDTKRLDWLCLHLRGAELRRVVGELNYTGDTAEFRRAIDAAIAAMQADKGGK